MKMPSKITIHFHRPSPYYDAFGDPTDIGRLEHDILWNTSAAVLALMCRNGSVIAAREHLRMARERLEEIERKWIPEIERMGPNVPWSSYDDPPQAAP